MERDSDGPPPSARMDTSTREEHSIESPGSTQKKRRKLSQSSRTEADPQQALEDSASNAHLSTNQYEVANAATLQPPPDLAGNGMLMPPPPLGGSPSSSTVGSILGLSSAASQQLLEVIQSQLVASGMVASGTNSSAPTQPTHNPMIPGSLLSQQSDAGAVLHAHLLQVAAQQAAGSPNFQSSQPIGKPSASSDVPSSFPPANPYQRQTSTKEQKGIDEAGPSAPTPSDSSSAVAAQDAAARLTGRGPLTLYMSCDSDSLSEYQCLVRKQIEIFEARQGEVESNAKGRNKPIVLGQVGIQCKHCSALPPKQRTRGAIYYPAKLNGLYQAAQSMASGHLCSHCNHIPPAIRQELLILRERKSSAGGGKKYWGDGVQVLGVVEDTDGLRFRKPRKSER
eukprot:Nitzschia sp. Nitz4//scaffold211_size37880//7144//8464//NITZ4_007700-RA/size37880-augustus-gene-0.58-mRNA-1//-1//CDS//3329541961//9423//frame0